MFCKKGFSLAEILIAVVLMALVILAVASVDITSRRFFDTASSESWIQDEAKIAMGHIIKNVQLGIGNMTNAEVADGTSPPSADNTRGFYILNGGNLATSGDRIQIKQDTDKNGRFDGTDKTVEYIYQGNPDYKIIYDEDLDNAANPTEDLAAGIVGSAVFSFNDTLPNPTPNQVLVTVTVRKVPSKAASLDNPETTLTSDIILRAMSTN
ncbi:MAG: prepilin-type N-terminal cleavage/methylation domain-containing protein [Omnitrophica bacterium]|nr:prepilin-type N-terminal cleavage/methylation domain-containing protein [Candidatus Omnitrophota bacterium]